MNIPLAKKLLKKFKELEKQDRVFIDGIEHVLKSEQENKNEKRHGCFCYSITEIAYLVLNNLTQELSCRPISDIVNPDKLSEAILLIEEFLEIDRKEKKHEQ